MHTVEDGSGLWRVAERIIDSKRSVRFAIQPDKAGTVYWIERAVCFDAPNAIADSEPIAVTDRTASQDGLYVSIDINPRLDDGIPLTYKRVLSDITDDVPGRRATLRLDRLTTGDRPNREIALPGLSH